MARKTITAKRKVGERDYRTEMRALQHFRNCLQTHRNIMQSFASFIHGQDFVILFPWAEGRDLHNFLYEPATILDNYPQRSLRFSPHNLLNEANNLAQALKFFHTEMYTIRGRNLKCAHLDLKPDNVLVFFPPNLDVNACPVGIWKIGDFGLSNVEESVAGNKVLPLLQGDQEAAKAPGNYLREISIQPTRRGPGAFQPPEVISKETAKVSTRRDVWSFGCILAMVLAFALKGPSEVAVQHQRRAPGSDDHFYRHNRASSVRPSAELKPGIQEWLDEATNLAQPQHSEWIGYCVQLILKLLAIEVIQRPEIDAGVADLNRLLTHTEVLATERLWNFHNTETVLEPATTIPALTVWETGPDEEPTFLGVPSNTPPSSAPRSPPGRAGHVSRGSRSMVTSRLDSTLEFAALGAPGACIGACLDPRAHVAALWAENMVFLHNLSHIVNDSYNWLDRPPATPLAPDEYKLTQAPIYIREHAVCEKVILAGTFVAVVERHTSVRAQVAGLDRRANGKIVRDSHIR